MIVCPRCGHAGRRVTPRGLIRYCPVCDSAWNVRTGAQDPGPSGDWFVAAPGYPVDSAERREREEAPENPIEASDG